MATCAVQDTPTTDEPFEALNEVGCAHERIKASLRILSGNIHEFFDGTREGLSSPVHDHLYDQWLMLEMIRGALAASDELFHRAENALYAARVPQQFPRSRGTSR